MNKYPGKRKLQNEVTGTRPAILSALFQTEKHGGINIFLAIAFFSVYTEFIDRPKIKTGKERNLWLINVHHGIVA